MEKLPGGRAVSPDPLLHQRHFQRDLNPVLTLIVP